MALSKIALSDLFYDKIHGTFKTPKKGRKDLRKLADALADAIVTHFTSDAEVNVTVNVTTTTTITPSDSGLQRDPATSNATLAPVANKTIAGTGTGTGTGTLG